MTPAPLRDYYAILGIAPDADAVAVRSAYRRLALKHHPDVAPDTRPSTRFLEIQEAYAVLGDPEKRREYDRVFQRSASRVARRPPARKPAARKGLRVAVDVLGVRLDLTLGADTARRGR